MDRFIICNHSVLVSPPFPPLNPLPLSPSVSEPVTRVTLKKGQSWCNLHNSYPNFQPPASTLVILQLPPLLLLPPLPPPSSYKLHPSGCACTEGEWEMK